MNKIEASIQVYAERNLKSYEDIFKFLSQNSIV